MEELIEKLKEEVVVIRYTLGREEHLRMPLYQGLSFYYHGLLHGVYHVDRFVFENGEVLNTDDL